VISKDHSLKTKFFKNTDLSDEQNSSGSESELIEQGLNPDVFILQVISVLDKYLEHHESWEKEANDKIKELMKVNSFTNAAKHKRLMDLLSGDVPLGN
jgi:hypothetical protein